mgnify:CR=1 FL=1
MSLQTSIQKLQLDNALKGLDNPLGFIIGSSLGFLIGTFLAAYKEIWIDLIKKQGTPELKDFLATFIPVLLVYLQSIIIIITY